MELSAELVSSIVVFAVIFLYNFFIEREAVIQGVLDTNEAKDMPLSFDPLSTSMMSTSFKTVVTLVFLILVMNIFRSVVHSWLVPRLSYDELREVNDTHIVPGKKQSSKRVKKIREKYAKYFPHVAPLAGDPFKSVEERNDHEREKKIEQEEDEDKYTVITYLGIIVRYFTSILAALVTCYVFNKFYCYILNLVLGREAKSQRRKQTIVYVPIDEATLRIHLNIVMLVNVGIFFFTIAYATMLASPE